MPKIPIVKAKDFYTCLLKYGCTKMQVRGSHHKIYNPYTNKTSTVSIHSGKDVTKGAFAGVLSQLGIDINDFIEFINKQ
jgi:predicted RNA binding protein YcfA (HicA-like mRNA interferase family)